MKSISIIFNRCKSKDNDATHENLSILYENPLNYHSKRIQLTLSVFYCYAI